MPFGRDPFPFPKLQNDNNFVGKRDKPVSKFGFMLIIRLWFYSLVGMLDLDFLSFF